MLVNSTMSLCERIVPAGGPALRQLVGKVSYSQVFLLGLASHPHEVIDWEDGVVVFGQPLLESSVLEVPSDQVFDATNARDGRRHECRDRFPHPGPGEEANGERWPLYKGKERGSE